MKLVIYIWMFVFPTIVFSQNQLLEDIRSCYEGSNCLEEVQALIQLSSSASATPVVDGYFHAAQLMLLDYQYNPLKKLMLFNRHTAHLDSIINRNPSDTELRLLRYSLQQMAPSFLMYNNFVEKDLNFIKKNVSDEPRDLKEYVARILNQLSNVRTSNSS